MVRGKLLFTALVVCAVMAVSCATDKQTAEKIRHAEKIMMELPDSALRVVQSIDPEAVRGKHDCAHYQLVVAEVNYYNRLAVDRDSITQPMFDYYISDDNHAERARALYQHALVMQAEGENARAMFSLLEAEKSLTHLDNPRLSGLVHRTKGDIYGTECLFQNALEEYQKSKECFDKAGLEHHVKFSEFNIGRSLIKMQRFYDAEPYLKDALEYNLEKGYNNLLSPILNCLSDIYVNTQQYDKLSIIFSDYDEFLKNELSTYFCYKSLIASSNNERKKAIEYLTLAESNECDPTHLDYTSYRVYRAIGDNEKALYYFEKCIRKQNDLTLTSLNAPILNLQIELGVSENIALLMRNENIKLRYTLFLTLLFFIIISGILYYKYRQKSQREEIEQYISTIKELQMTTKDLPSQMNYSIDKLYKSRFKELNDLYDIYYDSVGSARQMKIVFEQISNTINSIKCDKKRIVELEKIVNEYRGEIMSKLLEVCPNLSERQRKIALFSYAGFSLRAIALFMDSNPVQISKDKYKIKNIISSYSVTKDVELLIKSL